MKQLAAKVLAVPDWRGESLEEAHGPRGRRPRTLKVVDEAFFEPFDHE